MNKGILTDNENLLKLKDFYLKEPKDAFDCTIESLKELIKNEYFKDMNEKIIRWSDVTYSNYFENVNLIKHYFYSKMLYRDGYFKATIMVVRSICEMICYERYSNIRNPFDKKDISDFNFRLLINYLSIPKKITKIKYDKHMLKLNKKESIILKGFYSFSKNIYIFNEVKKDNIRDIIEVFKKLNCFGNDIMPKKVYKNLNKIYDIGIIYIHSKKAQKNTQNVAKEVLKLLWEVLDVLYGVNKIEVNDIMVSGYDEFPDLMNLNNLTIEVFDTPLNCAIGYYNLPNQKQFNNMFKLLGEWLIEWEDTNGNNKGILCFYYEEEYLRAKISYKKDNIDIIELVEPKLLGEKFILRGFDILDMKHHKNKHLYFKLKKFNDSILIGSYKEDSKYNAVAIRQK